MSEPFAPDAVAFDLDGTIYLAEDPLPGAVALIAALRRAGVPHLFATNNSSATACSPRPMPAPAAV